jgi:glycerate dehydrogenase
MKVIARKRGLIPENEPAKPADLDRIFRESDVLSLHCPLTPDTRHLVNAIRLSEMKRTAFLINTARGPLIDEAALATALNNGRLAGAGLDVLASEPPSPDNPLLRAKNCLITPHIAWATRDARARLLRIAAENLRAWQSGKPQNVVTS